MEDVLCNPFMIVAFTAFAVIGTACLVKIFTGGSGNKGNTYPPVVCTILNALLNFQRLHDYVTELASKNKTFRLLNVFQTSTFTVDPANVEYILKTNFSNYGKGKFHHNILKDLLGDGIFTVDGEKWLHQRKTASYEFSTKILRDFSSGVFRDIASKLALLVSQAASSNQIIEIQDMFMKSTLDSVFKIVLGLDLDSIGAMKKEVKQFTRCFDEASALSEHRYADPLWKLKKLLNVGSEAKLKKNIKVIDDFVYKIIHNKTEQVLLKPQDYAPLKKEDILSRFVEMNETDPKFLKDIILSFIIAGKDTTAVTLSWFFYMMCKHPNLQERIAEEVIKATKIKKNGSIHELANSITEEALSKMQYLHAALTETLRLYPAVPLDGKVCFADDTLPDGLRVRKGSRVYYVPWAMGRMKYIWGDDAEEFRPERWLDENGILQHQSSYKFTAFQAGPRICLGKEFAYRQMKIFSAVLLGSFIFRLSDEQKKVHYKTMLTLHIDGGLHLYAQSRWGGEIHDKHYNVSPPR